MVMVEWIATTTEEYHDSVERTHRSTCNKMETTVSWCGANTNYPNYISFLEPSEDFKEYIFNKINN